MILSLFIVYKKYILTFVVGIEGNTESGCSPANRKKQWYSLSNMTNCVDVNCHQSWKPNVPQDESHVCDQRHHNVHPFCQRFALVGKKNSSDVTFNAQLMSEHVEDLWHKPCATTGLSCPCHTRVKPNVTPNATINVDMSLNASKCQRHLTITRTMIATIILMCQHMHKTTDLLQLNRLQQATISWYWQWLPALLCPQIHQI